jgi:hypothetical protein
MLSIETKASELQEVWACWWSLPANPLHNTNKGGKHNTTKHNNKHERLSGMSEPQMECAQDGD